LLVNLIDLLFVGLFEGCLLNYLEHLHQAFGSEVYLVQHILFHSDIMGFVVSKQGTVRADTFFAIDANDFNLSFVLWAKIRLGCGCS